MTQEAAFIQTIQQYRGILYKAAALYTDRPEDREDLMQEILYQLWKSYGSFRQEAARSTWIYRVAMNVSIHYLKQNRKRPRTVALAPELLERAAPPDEAEQSRWDNIRRQIDTLSLLERGIVLLYLEDKSYREIGAIVGLSESNVGTRMARIKAKLKKRITEKKQA
ncbi:MAG: sigma-70 family RNA polymerase sigma factor [Bacteroidota bacterium]